MNQIVNSKHVLLFITLIVQAGISITSIQATHKPNKSANRNAAPLYNTVLSKVVEKNITKVPLFDITASPEQMKECLSILFSTSLSSRKVLKNLDNLHVHSFFDHFDEHGQKLMLEFLTRSERLSFSIEDICRINDLFQRNASEGKTPSNNTSANTVPWRNEPLFCFAQQGTLTVDISTKLTPGTQVFQIFGRPYPKAELEDVIENDQTLRSLTDSALGILRGSFNLVVGTSDAAKAQYVGIVKDDLQRYLDILNNILAKSFPTSHPIILATDVLLLINLLSPFKSDHYLYGRNLHIGYFLANTILIKSGYLPILPIMRDQQLDIIIQSPRLLAQFQEQAEQTGKIPFYTNPYLEPAYMLVCKLLQEGSKTYQKKDDVCWGPGCSGQRKDGVSLQKCSRCRTAQYCSAECQKTHWPEHKKTCVAPTQEGKPEQKSDSKSNAASDDSSASNNSAAGSTGSSNSAGSSVAASEAAASLPSDASTAHVESTDSALSSSSAASSASPSSTAVGGKKKKKKK